ncbi:MAG: AAA family ATPase [Alphaproteobacteria bacterium]|nr:AAA family ATPase [Alphaproteobacteria bacterium]
MATITSISLFNHPKIGDLAIDFGGAKHLILTGPNGSGKSTALLALAVELETSRYATLRSRLRLLDQAIALGAPPGFEQRSKDGLKEERQDTLHALDSPGAVLMSGDEVLGRSASSIAAFLPSRRSFAPSRTNRPPQPPTSSVSRLLHAANEGFYEWLKHQYLQALLARADGKDAESEALRSWLDWFTTLLRDVWQLPDLRIEFDRGTYELRFIEPSGSYWIEDLADGHASILAIVSELVMRLDPEDWRASPGIISGVVLIDEPETHLHPELEERILPFLTGTFPGVQFIVATHSPIVVASIPDAMVFDLRRREGTLSAAFAGKKYGELMMSHFGIETDFDLNTTRKLHELKELALRPGGRSDPRYEALLKELETVENPVVMSELLRSLSAADEA